MVTIKETPQSDNYGWNTDIDPNQYQDIILDGQHNMDVMDAVPEVYDFNSFLNFVYTVDADDKHSGNSYGTINQANMSAKETNRGDQDVDRPLGFKIDGVVDLDQILNSGEVLENYNGHWTYDILNKQSVTSGNDIAMTSFDDFLSKIGVNKDDYNGLNKYEDICKINKHIISKDDGKVPDYSYDHISIKHYKSMNLKSINVPAQGNDPALNILQANVNYLFQSNYDARNAAFTHNSGNAKRESSTTMYIFDPGAQKYERLEMSKITIFGREKRLGAVYRGGKEILIEQTSNNPTKFEIVTDKYNKTINRILPDDLQDQELGLVDITGEAIFDGCYIQKVGRIETDQDKNDFVSAKYLFKYNDGGLEMEIDITKKIPYQFDVVNGNANLTIEITKDPQKEELFQIEVIRKRFTVPQSSVLSGKDIYIDKTKKGSSYTYTMLLPEQQNDGSWKYFKYATPLLTTRQDWADGDGIWYFVNLYQNNGQKDLLTLHFVKENGQILLSSGTEVFDEDIDQGVNTMVFHTSAPDQRQFNIEYAPQNVAGRDQCVCYIDFAGEVPLNSDGVGYFYTLEQAPYKIQKMEVDGQVQFEVKRVEPVMHSLQDGIINLEEYVLDTNADGVLESRYFVEAKEITFVDNGNGQEVGFMQFGGGGSYMILKNDSEFSSSAIDGEISIETDPNIPENNIYARIYQNNLGKIYLICNGGDEIEMNENGQFEYGAYQIDFVVENGQIKFESTIIDPTLKEIFDIKSQIFDKYGLWVNLGPKSGNKLSQRPELENFGVGGEFESVDMQEDKNKIKESMHILQDTLDNSYQAWHIKQLNLKYIGLGKDMSGGEEGFYNHTGNNIVLDINYMSDSLIHHELFHAFQFNRNLAGYSDLRDAMNGITGDEIIQSVLKEKDPSSARIRAMIDTIKNTEKFKDLDPEDKKLLKDYINSQGFASFILQITKNRNDRKKHGVFFENEAFLLMSPRKFFKILKNMVNSQPSDYASFTITEAYAEYFATIMSDLPNFLQQCEPIYRINANRLDAGELTTMRIQIITGYKMLFDQNGQFIQFGDVLTDAEIAELYKMDPDQTVPADLDFDFITKLGLYSFTKDYWNALAQGQSVNNLFNPINLSTIYNNGIGQDIMQAQNNGYVIQSDNITNQRLDNTWDITIYDDIYEKLFDHYFDLVKEEKFREWLQNSDLSDYDKNLIVTNLNLLQIDGYEDALKTFFMMNIPNIDIFLENKNYNSIDDIVQVMFDQIINNTTMDNNMLGQIFESFAIDMTGSDPRKNGVIDNDDNGSTETVFGDYFAENVRTLAYIKYSFDKKSYFGVGQTYLYNPAFYYGKSVRRDYANQYFTDYDQNLLPIIMTDPDQLKLEDLVQNPFGFRLRSDMFSVDYFFRASLSEYKEYENLLNSLKSEYSTTKAPRRRKDIMEDINDMKKSLKDFVQTPSQAMFVNNSGEYHALPTRNIDSLKELEPLELAYFCTVYGMVDYMMTIRSNPVMNILRDPNKPLNQKITEFQDIDDGYFPFQGQNKEQWLYKLQNNYPDITNQMQTMMLEKVYNYKTVIKNSMTDYEDWAVVESIVSSFNISNATIGNPTVQNDNGIGYIQNLGIGFNLDQDAITLKSSADQDTHIKIIASQLSAYDRFDYNNGRLSYKSSELFEISIGGKQYDIEFNPMLGIFVPGDLNITKNLSMEPSKPNYYNISVNSACDIEIPNPNFDPSIDIGPNNEEVIIIEGATTISRLGGNMLIKKGSKEFILTQDQINKMHFLMPANGSRRGYQMSMDLRGNIKVNKTQSSQNIAIKYLGTDIGNNNIDDQAHTDDRSFFVLSNTQAPTYQEVQATYVDKLTLDGNSSFKVNSSELSDIGKQGISDMFNEIELKFKDYYEPDFTCNGSFCYLKKYLSDTGSKIHINGFTDSDGDNQYNLDLSKDRAESVMNYLLDNSLLGSGFENNIVASGQGEKNLIMNPNGTENKAASRRVEIGIY